MFFFSYNFSVICYQLRRQFYSLSVQFLCVHHSKTTDKILINFNIVMNITMNVAYLLKPIQRTMSLQNITRVLLTYPFLYHGTHKLKNTYIQNDLFF